MLTSNNTCVYIEELVFLVDVDQFCGLFLMAKGISMNLLVQTACGIGIIGSGTCILLVFRSQYKVLKQPYCVEAFQKLEKNKVAMELIGSPIQMLRPEVIDKKQIFDTLLTDIKVPFKGHKQSGELHILAKRATEKDEWTIERLECQLEQIKNKKLIVYKNQ